MYCGLTVCMHILEYFHVKFQTLIDLNFYEKKKKNYHLSLSQSNGWNYFPHDLGKEK